MTAEADAPQVTCGPVRDLFYPQDPTRWVGSAAQAGWVIGRDLGADLVVTDAGVVVAADGGRRWFVNSTVRQYQESLQIVGGLRDRLAHHSGDPQVQLGLESSRLESLDPAAMEPGSYWQRIVEQIREEQF